MDIIQLLLSIINDLNREKRMLLELISKYIPLKQWAFDDSHSPKYHKFKTDELPRIIPILFWSEENTKKCHDRTRSELYLCVPSFAVIIPPNA